MRVATAIARVVIGALFAGHGLQKLFGWFGGPGIEGTEKMMDNLGLEPAGRNARAVAVTETASGAMLVAGALTPLAAAGLIGSMITAIRTVHFENGPWVANQGYEYNLVLIAAAMALADAGPGALSVDRALGIDRAGSGWALAALGAGAAGSTAVLEAASSSNGSGSNGPA